MVKKDKVPPSAPQTIKTLQPRVSESSKNPHSEASSE